MKHRLATAMILAFLTPSIAQAELRLVSGKAKVLRGDALEVSGAQFRLFGIKSPGLLQYCRNEAHKLYHCGRKSSEFLVSLTHGKQVKCSPVRTGTIELRFARCQVSGTDLAAQMVRNGHAVALDAEYTAAEAEARSLRRGLWSGTFVKPDDWEIRWDAAPPVSSANRHNAQ